SAPARAVEPDSLLGLDIVNVDPTNAKRQGWPDGTMQGIGVVRVDAASPVAASIQQFDIIYAVGGKSVRSAADLTRALAEHAGPKSLELWVQRPSTGQRFTVRLP